MQPAAHPAPWTCRVRALLWWRPLPPGAAAEVVESVPAALRRAAVPLAVAAGLLDYAETPVGPYREVLAAVGLGSLGTPTAHVPFIAVDSVASAAAGRANWALPKEMAGFEGPGGEAHHAAAGDGWQVRARRGRRGPPLPVPLLLRVAQVGPDGPLVARLTGRGTVRACRVEVDADAPGSLPRWLPAGRCWGADLSATFTLAPARPS